HTLRTKGEPLAPYTVRMPFPPPGGCSESTGGDDRRQRRLVHDLQRHPAFGRDPAAVLELGRDVESAVRRPRELDAHCTVRRLDRPLLAGEDHPLPGRVAE